MPDDRTIRFESSHLADALAVSYSGRVAAHTLMFALGPEVASLDAYRHLNTQAASSTNPSESTVLSPTYSKGTLREFPDTTVTRGQRREDKCIPSVATEFMLERALPAAAYVIDLSYARDTSPYALVGARGPSHEGMPPFVSRFALYGALLSQGDRFVSISELSRRANLPNRRTHSHVAELSEHGLLEKKGAGHESAYPSYRRTETTVGSVELEELLKVQKRHPQTRRLARRLLFDLKNFDPEEDINIKTILHDLEEKTPEQKKLYFESSSATRHRIRVADVLQILEELGYVKVQDESNEVTDSVRLIDPGLIQKYRNGILNIVVAGSTALEAKALRQTAAGLIRDPEAVAWLLSVDHEKGAIPKKRLTFEEKSTKILSHLAGLDQEAPPSVPELASWLGETTAATSRFVNQMRDSGLVQVELCSRDARRRIVRPLTD